MKLHKQAHRIPLVITAVVLALATAFSAVSIADPAWLFGDEDKSLREAHELYKQAQQLLEDEHYKRAAQEFLTVYDRHAKSKYAADALYWRAFALYRIGGKSSLRDARRALEIQRDEYAGGKNKADAEALYYRVLGQLAEKGDSRAAEEIAKHADEQFDDRDSNIENDSDYDQEEKMAALQALITMRSERAIPLLKKVLQDRGPGKAKLRKQALFLLTQHVGTESVELLMDIASNDPDEDVRKSAIFWLSQVHTPAAAAFLERMLRESDDPEVLEQVVFAISQQKGGNSRKILREVALDPKMARDTRGHAIFWLAQHGGAAETEFLMDLYKNLNEDYLKEKVVFGVAQNGGEKGAAWLMKIVYDKNESIDARKNALFWAGQQKKLDLDELRKLYKTLPETELKEQVIFSFSQRSEKKALDIMMELAKKEKIRELRKQLIFWIGQSNDSRVEEFLLDIIND